MQAGAPLTGATVMQIFTAPVKIFHIEGNVNSTTGTSYYIQLLNTATPSSGTTIPLYSRLAVLSSTASGVNGFAFDYTGPDGLDTSRMNYPESATKGGDNTSGVWIAISSTDTVWTSVAANTDVTVDIEEQYNDAANETITGDTSTGVDSLAVWTDSTANTAKRLTRLSVTNNNGVTAYLMLFCYANPATGDLPIQQWQLASGATLNLFFGQSPPPIQQAGDSTSGLVVNYTYHVGCYLFGSSTTQYLTATSASGWTMKTWNI